MLGLQSPLTGFDVQRMLVFSFGLFPLRQLTPHTHPQPPPQFRKSKVTLMVNLFLKKIFAFSFRKGECPVFLLKASKINMRDSCF